MAQPSGAVIAEQPWRRAGSSPADVQREIDLFIAKCEADINYRKNAVAAVLSNEATKAEFLAELERQAETVYPELERQTGLKITGSTPWKTYSYTGASVADQLKGLSVKSGPGSAPNGQLTLLSYNGSEWSGLLKEAAPYLVVLTPGCLITTLAQVLFGTKAGALLLPALLINLL